MSTGDSRESARTVPRVWLTVVDRVLRPARPELERCLREGELHRRARQVVHQRRAAAIAGCVARIESARTAVFTSDTGAVPRLMTELEREWRTLSRKDPDDGLMDLWARLTPPAWHDRKRWRDNLQALKTDVAVALAADFQGVELAEEAVFTLRTALVGWGVNVGARIRWKAAADDTDAVTALLAQPLLAARAELASRCADVVVSGRSEVLRRDVEEAASSRLHGRPLLAAGIGQAAFVDSIVRAAAIAGRPSRPNPVPALRELWKTGYALVEADSSGVTLEVPAL